MAIKGSARYDDNAEQQRYVPVLSFAPLVLPLDSGLP
jgi:hypothetical protein